MNAVPKQLRLELIIHILFYILSIYILIKILLPIVNPVSVASRESVGQTTFYEKIINASIPSMEVMQKFDDDETTNNRGTLSIIFKYLTNIDIFSPKSYIASLIPMLQFMDMTSITSDESGPYIEVIPKNNELIPDNSKDNNTAAKPDKNEPVKQQETNIDKTNQSSKGKLDPAKPLILIYHTHTRENYNPLNVKDQDHTYNFNIGVCKVGEELKRELESKYGIAVIHDTTAHDVPTQGKGYSRSRKTVEGYLKKYPGLKLIIDLHRDSADRIVSTAKINNVYYSRVMFVIASGNKNKSKSIESANNINKKFNELYPGFSRGLYYSSKYAVYNEDLSPNLVLIEVGSADNSLDESIRTTKLLARVISDVVKK